MDRRLPLPPPPPRSQSAASTPPSTTHSSPAGVSGWNDPPETLFSSAHKTTRRAVRPPIPSSHSSPSLAQPMAPPYAHPQANHSHSNFGGPRPGPYSNYPNSSRTLPTTTSAGQTGSRSVDRMSTYSAKPLPGLPPAPPKVGQDYSTSIYQAPGGAIAQGSGNRREEKRLGNPDAASLEQQEAQDRAVVEAMCQTVQARDLSK